MGAVASSLFLRQHDCGEWNDQIVVLNGVVGITRIHPYHTILHTRGGEEFTFALDDAAFSATLSNWERCFPLWTFRFTVLKCTMDDTNVWINKEEITALQRMEHSSKVRITFKGGCVIDIVMTRTVYDDLVLSLAVNAVPAWPRFLC